MYVLEIQEVFSGEETGHIHITNLRKWLKKIKREPVHRKMTLENSFELIQAHEWDESFNPRVESLLRAGSAILDPMIFVKEKNSESGYIVDGWHRFIILYKAALTLKRDFVLFLTYVVSIEECRKFPVPLRARKDI